MVFNFKSEIHCTVLNPKDQCQVLGGNKHVRGPFEVQAYTGITKNVQEMDKVNN